MALTESSARRIDDADVAMAKDIKTFTDADGGHIQAVALVDDAGDQAGVTDNELQVDVVASGLPSGAATAANQQAAATAATLYNVTMTSADTEYSQALPANTKRFSLQCLTDFDVRFAFITGKVATPTAPYALVRAGMNYYEQQLNLASATLYLASPGAGKVAEIIAWS